MEQRFEVETPLGPVWLWGRDTGKPLIVVLPGLGAQFWVYDKLQGDFPEADVLRSHLPGNHSPPLCAASIGSFGAALSQALGSRFPGRWAVLVGISTGALVALSCPYRETAAMVLVEPFLRTAHIPELRQMFEAAGEAADRDLYWSALGVSAQGSEARDYSHLLGGLAAPVEVLLGDPGRSAPGLRSLVDTQDRAALAAHPLIRVTQVEGAGHNVAGHDAAAFLQAIRRARERAR